MTKRVRELAYQWHGGMWSPLYAFASSGVVRDRTLLLLELEDCKKLVVAREGTELENISDLAELEEIIDYVKSSLTNGRKGVLKAEWASPEYHEEESE